MGTEVLWPQDCLATQAPDLFQRRRLSPIPNPNTTHKLFRKAQSPEAKRRREGFTKQAKPKQQQKHLVMGHVTILKKGERIGGTPARREERGVGDGDLEWNAVMFATGRLEPETPMPLKQIQVVSVSHDARIGEGRYAGSAFSMSPSPRSLPLPSFSRGERCSADFDRSATVGLRRLLRLE